MKKIEIFADIGGVDHTPHTFMAIHHGDGSVSTLGFGPTTIELMGEGQVSDNRSHEFSIATNPIPISDAQYDRLMEYVRRTSENPPAYNVAGSWVDGQAMNCTGWVAQGLREAGIVGYFDFRLNAWNPYGQALAIWIDEGAIPENLTEALEAASWITVPTAINAFWRTALTWTPPVDPLALDLDGDGLETLGLPINGSTSPILFDHDADGLRTGTGWLKPDDAWLVLDRDGNGSIDSGRELFGADTQLPSGRTALTGLEALRTLDTNNDLAFDAADAAFTQVRLWQDLNSDGVSQSSELASLTDQGITRISLTETPASRNLGNGNSLVGTSVVTRRDGSTTTAANLALASNPFYRAFPDTIAWSADAQALPNMGGSGVLRDLREAMSLGTPESQALVEAVQAFAQAPTRDAQQAALPALLLAWAETGPDLNASLRSLPASWTPIADPYVPLDEQRARFERALGPGLDAIAPDWRDLLAQADFHHRNEPALALLQRAQDAHLITGWRTSDGGNIAAYRLEIGTPLYTDIAALEPGTQRVAILSAFNGQAWLGNLVTWFTATNGVFQTWKFVAPEAGRSPLIDQAYDALKDSVYGALALQTRLRPYLDAIDLVIDQTGIRFDTTALSALLDSGKASDQRKAVIDLVELQRYAGPTLDAIGFDALGLLQGWVNAWPADSLLRTELLRYDIFTANATTGTDRSDVYLGNDSANTFRSGAGNDTLLGGAGDDVLYGQASTGGPGNTDTYDGGAGNDRLNDHESSNGDVYRLSRGGGQDTIDDWGGTADRIEVGKGIRPEDLSVRNIGTRLVITVTASGEQFTVNGALDLESGGMAAQGIEEIRFADGTVWDPAAIRQRATQGTDASDALRGFAGADTLDGRAGNDSLQGLHGSDTLLGGAGDDALYGNANYSSSSSRHADTYDGGSGNDSLNDFESSNGDVYRLSLGGGQDVITDWGGSADRIEVGAGITPADLTLRNEGSRLIVTTATGERLTVDSAFDYASGGMSPRGIEEIRFADGTVWDQTAIRQQATQGSEAGDTLRGFAGADTLEGRGGNDLLIGLHGSDTLLGGAGDDALYGHTYASTDGPRHADTYDGGAGNDSLNDFEASDGDVYRLNRGGGRDTVTDWGGANDRIEMGAGITPADLVVTRSFAALNLSIAGTNDQIAIANGFASEANRIESVTFADGTVWDAARIAAAVLNPVSGTASADTLTGTASADWLQGQPGADTLQGRAGHDRLDGGAGNDTLEGGTGDDVLIGGAGADVYRFNAGDGVDTIQENDAGNADLDVIQFGLGINPDNVNYGRLGDDLYALMVNSHDKLVIDDWFLGPQHRVEQFRFDDGSVLLDRQVEALIQAMAAFDASSAVEPLAPTASITPPTQLLAPNALV